MIGELILTRIGQTGYSVLDEDDDDDDMVMVVMMIISLMACKRLPLSIQN
jgi:hypothetical protein